MKNRGFACRDFQVKTGIEFWWTKPQAFGLPWKFFRDDDWHWVTVQGRSSKQTRSKYVESSQRGWWWNCSSSALKSQNRKSSGAKNFLLILSFLKISRYFVKVSDSEHCEGPHRNATSKSRALYQPLADKFKGSKDTCKRKTTKKGTVGQYWVSK